MKNINIFSTLLKLFSFYGVIGIIVLATAVYGYSFYEIFKLLKLILVGTPAEGEVILQSLKAIDTVLLGVIFYIIALGLFELFIQPVENIPAWLQMRDLDQLKAKLIKVLVVVMGVSFTGRIVTWDGSEAILHYGVGLGAVVFALTYFLNVKMKEGKSKEY